MNETMERPVAGQDALPAWIRRWGIGFLAFVVLSTIGIVAFAVFRPILVLPRMSLAPGFALVDQRGETLTSEELRGAVTLYTFSYTSCETAPCAAVDSVMRAVHERLGELDGGTIPVRLVTISFDPERDTPEVLEAFASQRGADPTVWSWTTGDPAMLKNVIGGNFEVFFEERDDGTFRFDPAFVLVDGTGIIRARYRVGIPKPDKLLDDIALILKEAQASSGFARLAYEAAHLLACYP